MYHFNLLKNSNNKVKILQNKLKDEKFVIIIFPQTI